MLKINRSASSAWKGSAKSGEGTISTQSGALDKQVFGFGSRFAEQKGTNPEELIAAAHAGCFTMLFSFILEQEGLTADQLETKGVITLEGKDDGSFEISTSHLSLTAKVPGLSQEKFDSLVAKAKAGCPVSKALKVNIIVDSKLIA